jgi:hypothetical protein
VGRKPSIEKQAARYQARLASLKTQVDAEVRRGDLRAALRMVLGFGEDMAMESDAVRAVEMFQFHRGHLSPQQHDKLREAWRKAMNAAMGEIVLFLPEREVTP